MKKARATKILCAVVAMMMVLATGVSAMAEEITANSTVVYDTAANTYEVRTIVENVEANEMVTYMVHKAASMYTVTPDDIDYIDQKTATGTTETFTYTGTGAANALDAYKIYVGAQSLSAPLEGTAVIKEPSAKVTVDGNEVSAEIVNADATSMETVKKVVLPAGIAATVTDVKLNGTSLEEFFVIGDSIGFANAAAVTAAHTIAITTNGDYFTGAIGVKLGTHGIISDGSFLALGRVKGAYTECGVTLYNEEKGEEEVYQALGVSGNGGFAIQVEGEDLAETFAGCLVSAYAKDASTPAIYADGKTL